MPQFGQSEFPGPMMEIVAVKACRLDFHHPGHVAPLPVRDATAEAIPVELGENGVFR